MRSSFFLLTWFLLFTIFSNLGESFPVSIADIPLSPNQTINQKKPINEFQEPTPVPEITVEASNDLEYPLARNPGLVFGAVILVLIIIGGVIINSRFFKKK